MKKIIAVTTLYLILTLIFFVLGFSVSQALAEDQVNIYFSWEAPQGITADKLVISGLPTDPLEVDVQKLEGNEYVAAYDLKQLPDGTYRIKARVKTIWGQLSPESSPLPFVKSQASGEAPGELHLAAGSNSGG